MYSDENQKQVFNLKQRQGIYTGVNMFNHTLEIDIARNYPQKIWSVLRGDL